MLPPLQRPQRSYAKIAALNQEVNVMSVSEISRAFVLRDCDPRDPQFLTCTICARDVEPRLIEHPQVISGFVGQGQPLYVGFCGECAAREGLKPGQAVSDQLRAEMRDRYERLQLRNW